MTNGLAQHVKVEESTSIQWVKKVAKMKKTELLPLKVYQLIFKSKAGNWDLSGYAITVLQIKRGYRDNLGIISHISP